MVARSPRDIVLQFDRSADVLPSGKRLSDGMSAAVAVADTLWLTHDETVAIERLSAERTNAASFRYAGHRRFDLRGLTPGRSLTPVSLGGMMRPLWTCPEWI